MWAAPKTCREPGCFKASIRGSAYCEGHQRTNSAQAQDRWRKATDEISKWYHRAPWPAFKRKILNDNIVCQRLYDGVQCRNRSKLVHHLVSPRVLPALFVDPTNVVALCENCHPTSEGTPLWRVGIDYVATKFRIMSFGGTPNP
jgi:hypothetical protein